MIKIENTHVDNIVRAVYSARNANDNIINTKTNRFPQLDKQYYIDLAYKKFDDFGVRA